MGLRKTAIVAAGVALIGALAGCSGITFEERMARVEGEPAAYRDGYRDGCYTALEDYRRDNRRYDNDPIYAEGWYDGKTVCGSD